MELDLFLSSVYGIITIRFTHYRCFNLLVKVRFKKRGEYVPDSPFLHTLQLLLHFTLLIVQLQVSNHRFPVQI